MNNGKKPFNIALVNLPFAILGRPSIGLTLLKSVIKEHKDLSCDVTINYLNHDFVHFLGFGLYNKLANQYGPADWFFRKAAFPDVPDNAEDFFSRYYPTAQQQANLKKVDILKKRDKIDEFLDELIDKYRMGEAGIVGLTSLFSQNNACFALANRLAQRSVRPIVVMGGASCYSPIAQEIVRNIKTIDYVFCGSSLKSFPEFVRRKMKDRDEEINDIKGVCSRKLLERNPSVSIPLKGERRDINQVLELDYKDFFDSFEANLERFGIKPTLVFQTSQGCWKHEKDSCAFCGFFDSSYMEMKPGIAVKMIESLFQYSSKDYRLEATDSMLPRCYPYKVLKKLSPPANVTLLYKTKSDMTEEELKLLSEARVLGIQPGIESLNTSTLKLMRKRVTAFQNISLLINCRRYGISTAWNLLMGFPGETDESVFQKLVLDIPRLMHLNPPSSVRMIRFDRYSHYFDHYKEYELELEPFDMYNFIYPYPKKTLRNMSHFFQNVNYDAPYFQVTSKWYNRVNKSTWKWRERWYSSGELPQLFIKRQDGEVIIYDSRFGNMAEHRLEPIGVQILEKLVKPRSLEDLHKRLSHLPLRKISEQMAIFREKGFLFEENQQSMSILLPCEPSPPQLWNAG